ncbi:ABC transporter substrate-binding protein [Chlorogloeopsis sp. ULAP02]|uniref:sugar ABC transporter substrate-binding protein n=1 Tax=Chlorogloeopsis sp. ULAP02 TaxID=3107926 RepID=UPI0031354471
MLVALILSFIIIACTSTSKLEPSSLTQLSNDNRVLKIWWDKGFTLEEDEALQQLVKRWEQKTGNQIKLSFYNDDELAQKAQRALRAGVPPDLMISLIAERQLNPRLAWAGKLADLSDVIEPVKSFYPKAVLEAVHLYNNIDKKRSYYAVPIHQATIQIFYWRDLIKQVGRKESDIPKDWVGFWEFWKQVQADLRKQQNKEIYGLGFPFSIGASDTYYLFEQILEAYDVQILDIKGQLRVDDPKVRQGIIDSLDWYAKFYQEDYVPPEAVKWLNPDNNRNLLNRVVVMTPNPTLSIPSAVREDADAYRNKLGTIVFPNKPNDSSMRHLVTLKEVVLFAQSQNQKIAKDFLTYLIQPEIMGEYLKAAGGRNFPVLKPIWKDPFWTNPADPHISTVAKTLTNGQTRLFYSTQSPAYSLVLEENVWGKALNRIIADGLSPEQAANEVIVQIKQIFERWQQAI